MVKVYRVDLGRLPGSCPGGVGSIPAFVNRDSLKVRVSSCGLVDKGSSPFFYYWCGCSCSLRGRC